MSGGRHACDSRLKSFAGILKMRFFKSDPEPSEAHLSGRAALQSAGYLYFQRLNAGPAFCRYL